MSKLTREEARDLVMSKTEYVDPRNVVDLLMEVQERTARECAEIARERCIAAGTTDKWVGAHATLIQIKRAFSLSTVKEPELAHIHPAQRPPKEQEPEPTPVEECGGCKHFRRYRSHPSVEHCNLNPKPEPKLMADGCGQWEAKP